MDESISVMKVVCYMVTETELAKPRDQRAVVAVSSDVSVALDQQVLKCVAAAPADTGYSEQALYLYALLQLVEIALSREDNVPYTGLRIVASDGKDRGASLTHPELSLLIDPDRLNDPTLSDDLRKTITIH